MKILWLTHMLPYPPTGGSLIRTHHLLRETSRFADVDVLSFVQPTLMPRAEQIDEAVKELGRFCRVLGTYPIPFATPTGKTYLAIRCALMASSYTTSWTYSRAFAQAVRDRLGERYDLLVLDTIGLARNVPRTTSSPIVLNHHNEEVSMLERRACKGGIAGTYFSLESRYLKEECRRFYPRVVRHLVTSQLDLDRLRTVETDVKATIIANGVDTEDYGCLFEPGGKDDFTILFVGGAGWYPNRDAIDWLVDEIWPLTRQRIPSSRLVVIGRSPTRKSLEAASKDKRLIVTGYVDDIRPWARRADAFVCPMRDGGGTRLKILHAFSMGLPVVSTAIGMEGVEALAGKDYLAAETADEFAAQLSRLAGAPADRTRLSKEGRSLVVSRYDWKQVGASLADCLREITTADQVRTFARTS